MIWISSEVSPFSFSIFVFLSMVDHLSMVIATKWTLILKFSVDSQYDEKSNACSFNKGEKKK